MQTCRFVFLVAMSFLGLAGAAVAQVAAPIIQTEGGTVRGTVEGKVIAWKGIPFAAPPVGDLRWRAPQPVLPWKGELDASTFGPSCVQANVKPVAEDCLTLNIWRPTNAGPGPLPVMVWIHGGILARGGANLYPGNAMAAQGVVAVTLNYRLGRLGFFAHPALAAEAPKDPIGNYGHLDQLAALEWVHRNIGNFGGDPTRVTLYGESAGGASVLGHLTSPLTPDGLFQAAILESPGVPTPRASELPLTPLDKAERIALDYAASLGVKGDGSEALAALRAVPAKTFAEGMAGPDIIATMNTGAFPPGYAAAILDGRFFVETPEAALAAGHIKNVPIIIGANSLDLGIGRAGSKDDLWNAFGPLANEARALYDPDHTADLTTIAQPVLGQRTLIEPARHMADVLAGMGRPVWHYRFSYVWESQRDKMAGTLHGYEIPFIMGIPEALVGAKATTDADREMAALASAYWTTFAETHDPNGNGRPEWPQHIPHSNQVFNFTDKGTGTMPDPIGSNLDLVERSQGR